MKVCLQSGHKNLTSGATGASGERDWTSKIVPMIAERLRAKGIEVYETDYYAYNDSKVVETDWNLFLSIHYDADVYGNTPNPTGGFTDFPEPATDYSTKESQRIAGVIKDYYFPMTGIKYVSRSNANTRYYYMWQYLSQKTPCVILECGVGNRKPEDYETLRNYTNIADVISGAILKALGIASFLDEDIPSGVEEMYKLKEIERYSKYWSYNELISDWVKLVGEYNYEKDKRKEYQKKATDFEEVVKSQAESIKGFNKEIESLSKAKVDLSFEIAQLQEQFIKVSKEKDSLLKCCEDYEVAVPKLKSYIKELEGKLISQDPLKDYSAKELWSALFDKVFNRA